MTSPLTMYGIKNCDTVKKARAWLDGHGLAYDFHDYKARGIDAATLGQWADIVGWERLLNRQGTTFRKLPDAAKADLTRESAIALMIAQPSMIRRPIVTGAGDPMVGFDTETFDRAFG